MDKDLDLITQMVARNPRKRLSPTEAQALDEWHCGVCLGTHAPSPKTSRPIHDEELHAESAPAGDDAKSRRRARGAVVRLFPRGTRPPAARTRVQQRGPGPLLAQCGAGGRG